jgi:hypothetical protein
VIAREVSGRSDPQAGNQAGIPVAGTCSGSGRSPIDRLRRPALQPAREPVTVLEPLPRPFECLFTSSATGKEHFIKVPISIDPELEWLISVGAFLWDRGSHHELGYGIHIVDIALDDEWMEFNRARAKSACHPEVKPYVRSIAYACCRALLDKVKPERVFRVMADRAPLDVVPKRFRQTTRLLHLWGYDLVRMRQRVDGRWEWFHVKRRWSNPADPC